MKILIINQYGNSATKTTSLLPRVGDKVDLFYQPFPTVTQVLLWPSDAMKARVGITDIVAIVTVE